MEIGFSLGSNKGDRLAYLQKARDRLAQSLDARHLLCSPVYETEPVGVKPEYRHLAFLNAVVLLTSDQPGPRWAEAARRIEDDLARRREADRYAPRTIDIDLIYAGHEEVNTDGLKIPHPRWMDRRFVVQPLADLRPDLVLPGAGHQTVRHILEDLPDTPVVQRLCSTW